MLPAKKQRYKSTITNLSPEDKTVTLQDGTKIKYNKVLSFSSFCTTLYTVILSFCHYHFHHDSALSLLFSSLSLSHYLVLSYIPSFLSSLFFSLLHPLYTYLYCVRHTNQVFVLISSQSSYCFSTNVLE